MPTYNKIELITELQKDVQKIISIVKAIPDNDELLNRQPAYKKWSGAQVLEHLNFYNKAYLPQLEKKLTNANDVARSFKSGWLGNYFTNVMKPGVEGEIANKMSAPKDSRPVDVLNSKKVVIDFLNGQERLLSLLEKAKTADLDARVPTSISKLIKLKAGDTFRFLIAHQQRHMLQLQRAIS